MALIDKACIEGDLGQCDFRVAKLPAGSLHTKPAHILTDGTVMSVTKNPRQMDRMHIHVVGHLLHGCGRHELIL